MDFGKLNSYCEISKIKRKAFIRIFFQDSFCHAMAIIFSPKGVKDDLALIHVMVPLLI